MKIDLWKSFMHYLNRFRALDAEIESNHCSTSSMAEKVCFHETIFIQLTLLRKKCLGLPRL